MATKIFEYKSTSENVKTLLKALKDYGFEIFYSKEDAINSIKPIAEAVGHSTEQLLRFNFILVHVIDIENANSDFYVILNQDKNEAINLI